MWGSALKTLTLAARLATIVTNTFAGDQQDFIQSRDFFLLSTNIARTPEALERFPGSQLVIEGTIDNVFVNCARYVHPRRRVGSSPYVPDAAGNQPFPSWKRIDLLQPFLPSSDGGRAEPEGGEITIEDYAKRVENGTP